MYISIVQYSISMYISIKVKTIKLLGFDT